MKHGLNTDLMKLTGNKTHIVVVIVLILCICKWQGWVKVPDEAYVALLAAGLSFLRMGVAKAERCVGPAPVPYTDEPIDLLSEYPPQPKSPAAIRVEPLSTKIGNSGN